MTDGPTGRPCPAGEAARSWLDSPDTPGAEIFGGEGCQGVLNGSGVCTTCGTTQGGYPLRREDYPRFYEWLDEARRAPKPDKPFTLPDRSKRP